MTKHMKYTELQYGELYITTKEHTYSNFDDSYERVTIPVGEKLLFRSFQPYGKRKDSELSLFYWFKHQITVCLVVSDKTPVLHIKHVEWDKRHEIGNVQDVEES